MGVERNSIEDFVVTPCLTRELELLDRVSEQLEDHSPSDIELISALSGALDRKRVLSSSDSLYREYWGDFATWCRRNALDPLPAELSTILRYIRAQWFPSEGKVQPNLIHTERFRVCAIKMKHQEQQISYLGDSLAASDLVDQVLTAARKVSKAELVLPQRSAILRERHIRRATKALSECSPTALRDQAVLLSGYFGGIDESGLSTLDFGDVESVANSDDLRLILRKENGIHYAVRELQAILWSDLSPVGAMKRWIAVRGTSPGPLFVTDTATMTRLDASAIEAILVDTLCRIGFDPSRYSSKSLKHSFALDRLSHGPLTSETITQGNLRLTAHESLHLIPSGKPDKNGARRTHD
ncbi:hypothetical protein [Rhodococcus sp. IEGM 1406]|uniref:hypothetical protein n=1 Tax=Rhodococcus sp. IEGM 1406 TaxID=3047083 RepID=UPI0024B7BB31|nr:hypothetical protein [Rhodococcus sp. IEGM 1406]MDI9907970.1 hypothetical protein [Rhodococcus sp. IEGM 1406]